MSQMLEQRAPEQQPSEQQGRKNRFAVSREVQTEFVDAVARAMNELAEKIRTGDKPAPVPQQYCPVTGHAYAGPNMTRLLLESMRQGFTDDRWLTVRCVGL